MINPSLSDIQFEFGRRLGRGDLKEAARIAAQCRAAWPAERAGWLFGSIAALLEGNKEAALALINERLATHPTDVQCLLQKAECLLALGERSAALEAADAAAQGAADVFALDAIGRFYACADDYRRSLNVYDRAVTAAPRDPTVRAGRADAHRVLGNLDSAAADYKAVLEVLPASPKALYALVGLRRQSSARNCIPALTAALTGAPKGSIDSAILHFAMAKAQEDLENYQESWAHLSAGNAIERANIRYAADNDRAVIEQMIEAFPSIEEPRLDTTGESPIFIVGLPRTGSTLVERIIGSHSKVHSAGELVAFPEAIDVAIRRLPDSQPLDPGRYIAAQRDIDAVRVAEEYLARVRTRRGTRPRFTDKLLTNFLHCALILRAFPKARIVHVTRHALAACCAIYRTRFAGTHTFAYDLTEIGEFYVGYHRIMAHWHRVLPGRIMDVAYEDVVNAQEETTRRVFEYLDMPFEAACLDFQRNPAPVKTTSMVQVRQTLYDSALNQWQHYAPQLAPLRSILAAAGIPVE